VYLDGNRFLTPTGDTRFEFTYKVPFSELLFTLENGLWQAQIVTTTYLEQDGQKVKYSETPNRIVTRDEAASTSRYRYFTDRIVLTLGAPMRFSVEVRDVNSGKTKNWEIDIPLLGAEDVLSDLDCIQAYAEGDSSGYPRLADPESLKDWKWRFMRNGVAYRPCPDHVVDVNDPFCWYYQGFHYSFDENEPTEMVQTLNIRNEKDEGITVCDTFYVMEERFDRVGSIRLDNLAEGRYKVRLTLTDTNTGKGGTREDFILLQARKKAAMRIFVNIEDEFKIIRFLDPTLQVKDWNALSADGKSAFLDWFWSRHDSDPNSVENEFFEEIRKRVSYANENYSRFGDGWQTDRGKIYISRGAPDEVTKGTTYGNSRSDEGDAEEQDPRAGIMGARDYQVWKYYMKGQSASFLFLDTQASGNMRLLLKRENGHDEVYISNWSRLMGSDFDDSVLD
jgi:GWxTD domain-containing protein